ncbi:hypothetical protein CALCODRAFT_500479 [Calocera cornea HHB12733]|uniref:Uncharacterized protein n=1 Tax=Calocera cornea HHB12733 TaxID=1353952 RepID=A0A165E1W8_9BASI|nr:hypothetical protein CALCODRAFT_500479 [Calocera cornea HHB12733]
MGQHLNSRVALGDKSELRYAPDRRNLERMVIDIDPSVHQEVNEVVAILDEGVSGEEESVESKHQCEGSAVPSCECSIAAG